jgi:dTDP-4-amino-4,6-dideoxygalactose transaminase
VTATEPRRIPFVDLRAEHDELRHELLGAFTRTLDRNAFVRGPDIAAFESAWAAFCGVDHCVGVGSGTAALRLILEGLRIGTGDEVLVPANTFVATAMAISAVGAAPVVVDCDPVCCTIDVEAARAAVTARTRALVAVHLYGLPARLDELGRLCRDTKIELVEDACQAHGARYRGRSVGSFGRATAFSFYPSKNLGALGDGGAVTTNDAELAERIRLLRDLGGRRKHVHELVGHNERLDGVQAAFLLCKLPHLERWNARRRALAAAYDELLRDVPLELPFDAADCDHSRHLYVVRCDDRDRVRQRLAEHGIETGLHYPVPIHRQPAYASNGASASYPVSERHCDRVLSLPLFPQMTDSTAEEVASRLREALEAPGQRARARPVAAAT